MICSTLSLPPFLPPTRSPTWQTALHPITTTFFMVHIIFQNSRPWELVTWWASLQIHGCRSESTVLSSNSALLNSQRPLPSYPNWKSGHFTASALLSVKIYYSSFLLKTWVLASSLSGTICSWYCHQSYPHKRKADPLQTLWWFFTSQDRSWASWLAFEPYARPLPTPQPQLSHASAYFLPTPSSGNVNFWPLSHAAMPLLFCFFWRSMDSTSTHSLMTPKCIFIIQACLLDSSPRNPTTNYILPSRCLILWVLNKPNSFRQ